jgi:hypothetical protein
MLKYFANEFKLKRIGKPITDSEPVIGFPIRFYSTVSAYMGIQALTFPNTHISTYRKIIPTPLMDKKTHTKIVGR